MGPSLGVGLPSAYHHTCMTVTGTVLFEQPTRQYRNHMVVSHVPYSYSYLIQFSLCLSTTFNCITSNLICKQLVTFTAAVRQFIVPMSAPWPCCFKLSNSCVVCYLLADHLSRNCTKFLEIPWYTLRLYSCQSHVRGAIVYVPAFSAVNSLWSRLWGYRSLGNTVSTG